MKSNNKLPELKSILPLSNNNDQVKCTKCNKYVPIDDYIYHNFDHQMNDLAFHQEEKEESQYDIIEKDNNTSNLINHEKIKNDLINKVKKCKSKVNHSKDDDDDNIINENTAKTTKQSLQNADNKTNSSIKYGEQQNKNDLKKNNNYEDKSNLKSNNIPKLVPIFYQDNSSHLDLINQSSAPQISNQIGLSIQSSLQLESIQSGFSLFGNNKRNQGNNPQFSMISSNHMELISNQKKKIKDINAWKKMIKELPIIIIHNPLKYDEDKKECIICLGEFKEGEKGIILPCIHLFHHTCLIDWFEANNNTCPICQIEINENSLQ